MPNILGETYYIAAHCHALIPMPTLHIDNNFYMRFTNHQINDGVIKIYTRIGWDGDFVRWLIRNQNQFWFVSSFFWGQSIQNRRMIKRKLTVFSIDVYITKRWLVLLLKLFAAVNYHFWSHSRFNFLQSNQSICELTTHFKRRLLIYLRIFRNRLLVMPNMAKSSFNQWESLVDDKWVRNRLSKHITLSHI